MRTTPRTGWVTVVSCVVTGAAVFAQTAARELRPTFDVASIKRTVEQAGGPAFSAGPGGRLHALNNPVMNLIQHAYDLPSYRVTGAPDWVTSDRYDVEAKADGDPSRAQMMLMLQALLEERFTLTVHRERRDGPVYILKIARGGHRLQESKAGGCISIDPRNPPRASSQPRRLVCGNNLTFDRGALTAWRATRIDMNGAADLLSREVRRSVINETGLTAFYDISVDLPPIEPATPVAAGPDAAAATGPSFFTVLREQLGLTLEPARGPVDMLVIDRIERPTES